MSGAERKDTPEQAAFRSQCQAWLADNHPGRPPVPIPQGALELSDPAAMTWLQQWQQSARRQTLKRILMTSMEYNPCRRLLASNSSVEVLDMPVQLHRDPSTML